MKRVDFPEPVKALVGELKRLPGIGPRSAERIAVWLLQSPKADPAMLAGALLAAKQMVRPCPVCGFFATEAGCDVCDDPARDDKILCVVEQATDVLPLERSGAFRGRYHCLGGKLSPLDRVSPEDLRIPPLVRRIEAAPEEIEVILALGSDVEGEATANYLAELLRGRNCRLTRIAQGLPAGGGLEHADELTLMRALQGRRSV
jgi:recombination protein RecR